MFKFEFSLLSMEELETCIKVMSSIQQHDHNVKGLEQSIEEMSKIKRNREIDIAINEEAEKITAIDIRIEELQAQQRAIEKMIEQERDKRGLHNGHILMLRRERNEF